VKGVAPEREDEEANTVDPCKNIIHEESNTQPVISFAHIEAGRSRKQVPHCAGGCRADFRDDVRLSFTLFAHVAFFRCQCTFLVADLPFCQQPFRGPVLPQADTMKAARLLHKTEAVQGRRIKIHPYHRHLIIFFYNSRFYLTKTFQVRIARDKFFCLS
jgi:hypothetical protein